MNRILQISILTLVILILASCRSLYVPNGINAPVFTKKKELEINALTFFPGTDIQLAYSLNERFAVMTNISGGPIFPWSHDLLRHEKIRYCFGEFGLGYYKNINPDFQFGIYSGYGIGYANGQEIGIEGDIYDEGFYSRVFLQPLIGYLKEKQEYSFSIRAAYIWPFPFQKYEIGHSMNSTLYEPVITYKNHKNRFGFMTQIGASLNFDEPIPPMTHKASRSNFIMKFGISYRIIK